MGKERLLYTHMDKNGKGKKSRKGKNEEHNRGRRVNERRKKTRADLQKAILVKKTKSWFIKSTISHKLIQKSVQ